MVGQRRYFGNIRRRESGRYQARYGAPGGRMLSAPHTFARKADAARWLMLKEAESGSTRMTPAFSFGNYAHQWLQDRVLKVRTRGLYEGLLRNHLNPTFDRLGLVDIDEAAVQVAKRAPRHWQGCRAHVQRGHGRQGIPAPALDSGNRSR